MKIKILKVYELNGSLRVETECKFGKDNLGLGLHQKFINPATDKPRYLDEVKKLLKKKYMKEEVKEKAFDKAQWGKSIEV